MSDLLTELVGKAVRVGVLPASAHPEKPSVMDGSLCDYDAQWLRLDTDTGFAWVPICSVRWVRELKQ